jgi:hypothetical protein
MRNHPAVESCWRSIGSTNLTRCSAARDPSSGALNNALALHSRGSDGESVCEAGSDRASAAEKLTAVQED